MIKFKSTALFILLILAPFAKGQEVDTLLQVLKEELKLEMNELSAKDYPPYYMDFRLSDIYTVSISTFNGNIVDVITDNKRIFKPTIRVGSYEFDNTHQLENTYGTYPPDYSLTPEPFFPIDNNPEVIKFKIWENTNNLYQNSVNEYKDKLAVQKTLAKSKVDDFSQELPEKYFEAPLPDELFSIDIKCWETKLLFLDSIFAKSENYYFGASNFSFTIKRNYFVSSEGTEIVQNKSFCSVSLTGFLKLDEDELIPFSENFNAPTPAGLPDNKNLRSTLEEKALLMNRLSKAPRAEPYAGPAMLSAEATGVFFHEIFGHRIEGHRLNDRYNSKTFKAKLGEFVLPRDFSVISDPTLTSYGGITLMGYYKYDDQGIKSKRVVNVDRGVLKNFLMSRKPIDGFPKSNGHGRADIFSDPVSRQSNLLVLTGKALSDKALRKKLIKECKKQGKLYGYYFKSVSGGYTNTMIFTPDYFNVMPTEVYRVYTDGRADELVRGVNLIGTPLLMFSEILAAGDAYSVFSGVCGAESGLLPVSTIAPAIIVNKIETQNKFTVKPEWPILPPPETE